MINEFVILEGLHLIPQVILIYRGELYEKTNE